MSSAICNRVEKMVLPIIEQNNLILWDVEYKKEGAYYLRVYIDKENVPVSMSDCENVSRPLSDLLDEQDFIKDSYFLEVASAGLERELTKTEHFEKYKGSCVSIKLFKAIDGIKEIEGTLVSADEKIVTIIDNEQKSFDRKDCAKINLKYDFGKDLA